MMRLLAIIFLLIPIYAWSGDVSALPYFASIKSGEANIRTGPGKRYPIKWVITHKNVPVEVISEFEQWRKIRDVSGDEGWVHHGMISTKRFVTLQSLQVLRRSDRENSRPLAKIEQDVSARLKTCAEEWCEVEVNDISGWVSRKALWGVYPKEIFRH